MDVKANYDFFNANFEELYKKYPGKFLVLKDQSVVKTFSRFDEAADYGLLTYGAGKFSVQQCVPSEKRMFFSSRRVVFSRA